METALAAPGLRYGPVRKLAFILPLALLLVAGLRWYSTVAAEPGGLEAITRRSDFVSNLTGAYMISHGEGQQLYSLSAQAAAQNRVLAPYRVLVGTELLPYNHLPFEALLTAPAVALGLPYPVVFGLWSLLMLATLALSLRLLWQVAPVSGGWLPVLVLAALSYGPVTRSFVLGQNSPLVLLGLCGLYAGITRKSNMWSGAALVLLALKPQVLPLVLLLLVLQRRWQILAIFGGLLGALCLLTVPLLGISWPLDYARLLVGVAGWGNAGAIDPSIMHNWRGLATVLFGNSLPSLVTPLYLALSLASAGLVAWTWWRLRAAANPSATGDDSQRELLLWALVGLLAVPTSLHLNPHDLTLLIFPAWLVAAYALRAGTEKPVSVLLLGLLWADYALLTLLDQSSLVVIGVLLVVATALLLLTQLPLQSTRRVEHLG